MAENKRVSDSDVSRFKNQYVDYRRQVQDSKNFADKLETASSNTKPNTLSSSASANATASEKSKKEVDTKSSNTEKKENVAATSNKSEVQNSATNVNAAITDDDLPNAELSPKMTQYMPNIKSAAQKYNLPAELIAGVIWQESRANPKAVSPCGAMGLMQLMPATAAHLGVQNPFDAAQNIEGGSKYIRQMLDRFNGNVNLAVAAYNAGPGNVEKYNRTVPPFKETQEYVPRVLGYASNFKASGLFIESTTTMRA